MFCDGIGLTAPSGECDEGYFCVSGINNRRPQLSNYTTCVSPLPIISIGGVCPAGYYCPKGSSYYKGNLNNKIVISYIFN